ncbi:hypothetical protein [Polaromonas sp.]|uniref:hypothetical protein n=1 Tax=Polaromonas sp. TaxID=1869339 RepID=UPI00184D2E9A|nr:hypothetical protein [Polaromonas sp.]NML85917.1 hypothetical protein [Polaromonas sp.]
MTLQTLDARPQAQLPQGPFHQWTFPNGTEWTLFYRLSSSYLLRFPDLADFEVSRDGRKATAWPVPGVSPGTVEHLHLNQVLPLALSRQGRLVLHASAVVIDGKGVAFTGESGRGKSTLAASFATTGARFLTDDGLQLDWLDGQCRITPSHPSVRLWEDSQEALIPQAVDLVPAVEYTTKARLLAGDAMAFCDQLQPLRRVYFLGEGVAPSLVIEAVRPAEALMELVRNSFLLDIEEKQLLAWHFDEMVRLAELPIYYRLDYPRRYEDLPRVREAIIRHAIEEESKVT